jgi:sulfopyruvate decarboxylase TPP-binding subunit
VPDRSKDFPILLSVARASLGHRRAAFLVGAVMFALFVATVPIAQVQLVPFPGIILIQNTGLMESGDSLRGWALGLNIPVVLMVGYRGWTRHGVNSDTAATYTERFLHAFGITYYLVETSADAPRISIAFEEARRTRRPVAVLMADEYHGFNR